MDITPEYNLIPAKEKIQVPEIDYQMGDQLGGQVLGSDARYWGSGEAVGVMDENGLYIGSTDYSTAPFWVNMSGAVVASSLTVTGGTIKSGKTSFTDSTNSGYYLGTEGIYAGDAADATKFKFNITTGAIDFIGASISSPIITSIQSGSEIAIQGWQSDLTFTSTNYRIAAWSSGTITLLDGTTYSIDAGNTGNMVAITYIYLDIGTSETVLQKTTTATTAVGSGKILLAVAQNNSDTAGNVWLQTFGGKGGIFLGVDNIAANSSSTNEFITNTAQIKEAIINDAHITGTITVGKTDAKCTDALADQTSVNTAANIAGQGDLATTNEEDANVLNMTNAPAAANADVTGDNTAADTALVSGLAASRIAGWAHGSDTTKIDGGDIYTNTVTATQISVTNLAALNADLGSITAGDITLDSSGYIKGGQTAYNTGVGFFLGYDTDAYKFSIGDPDGNHLTFNGSILTLQGQQNAVVGDQLILSEDSEITGLGGTYNNTRKKATIYFGGTIRIKFDIKSDHAGHNFCGKIFRDGVAVGTPQCTTSTSYSTKSEDISGWSPGEEIQLREWAESGYTGSLKNFRIYVYQYKGGTVWSQ